VNAISVFGNGYVQSNLGVGVTTPNFQLDLNGGVGASKGVRFPDGTIQITVAIGGASQWNNNADGMIIAGGKWVLMIRLLNLILM
jgi:hypothetical protein